MDKLISLSRLFDYIREHSEQALSSNEKNELEQIWDSSDTLNCFGKPLKKGYTDNVLIDEEWQVFKSKIPNCSENLKNIITDFAKYMDLMKNKNEILANNIYTSCIDLYDINKIGENLKQVNKDNLFDVLKNYYVINPDGSFFSFIARTGIIMSLEDEQEECDKIKTKLIECSKIIIENAKSKNVYCKDYEKIINKKLSDIKNNINGKIAWKELAYATDRLYERTIVTADKNRKKEVIEPNGKFDKEFYQGYTCDCWLLSALRAICNNEFALEKINDIVSVQKDKNVIKSVKVTLDYKNYVIDYERLKGSCEYASGDLDVRALEIAMNEYFHENHLDDINEGGFTTDSFKYLLNGHLKAINKYKMNSSKEINSFFEFMKQPNQIAIIQSDIFGIENVSATDADGNSVPIKPNHSYTAIRSDEKYLHLIDVEDSEREIHIEREKVPKCFKEASAVLLK